MNWRNTVTGQFAQNVIHMEDASETKTAEQLGAVIDTIWWGGDSDGTNHWLRAYTSTNVTLQNLSLQRLWPGAPLASQPYVTNQVTGHKGLLVKHPVLGFLFRLTDGLAGRAHRGRLYHYGAPGDILLDNGPQSPLFGAGGIPLLIDRWLNEFGPLPATGWHWNIFHKNLAGADRWTRITNIQLVQHCAVQRRRNFGVGI